MFELNQKLIDKFGEVALYDIAMEESAELLQAINKIKRHGQSHERLLNLALEIADIEIVIARLKEQFILDYDVNYFRTKKINELNKIMEVKNDWI